MVREAVLQFSLSHRERVPARSASQRAPSPACGGGWGGAQMRTHALAAFPLPVPPPQAGEGTLEQTLMSKRRV
jgi:hypothetical protein